MARVCPFMAQIYGEFERMSLRILSLKRNGSISWRYRRVLSPPVKQEDMSTHWDTINTPFINSKRKILESGKLKWVRSVGTSQGTS